MKKSKKSKYLNLLKSALLAGTILTGCTSSSQLTGREEKKNDFQNLEMKLVPFQNYSPETQSEKIDLKDDMLDNYLSENYNVAELSLSVNRPDVLEDVKQDPLRTIHIKDYDKFKSEIIRVSNELGYSEDSLSNLSVYDAVLLSGKIVAHKLDYYHEMISEQENDFSILALLLNSLECGKDSRNEEAKRIDSTSQDQIFFEGKGICRNYAGVNSAVFQVLKDMDPNLKNTYMKWYCPEDLSHNISLPHAWNQVSTVKKSNDNLEVLITYVDPTWLDTRNKTIFDTGEKVEEVNEEEIYNALDEAHFFSDTLIAHVYLADLYQTLGKKSRSLEFLNFNISEEAIKYYNQKEFEKRIDICDRILNDYEKDGENFEYLKFSFLESFQKSIENITESYIGLFLKYGLDGKMDYEKDINKFEELNNLYQRASNLIPSFSNLGINYTGYEGSCLEGTDKSVPKFITTKDLFNELKSEYFKE